MEKSVLIVDDSNTNNILIQNVLEAEGIKSSIAFSGDEAFQLIKTEKPSLILLDIMMPIVDGFTVLEKIKENPDTKQIPVIFVTARNDNQVKHKALSSGAVDFVQKPIDINKLIELVKIHLSN